MSTTRRLSDLLQFWVYDGGARADGHPHVGAIHAPEACEAPCPYHSPSDHPLRDAPMTFAVMWALVVPMRVCEHQVAHPDPDGIDHLRRVGLHVYGTRHECCATECCGGVS